MYTESVAANDEEMDDDMDVDDEKKTGNFKGDNIIRMEGYLKKQSLHLKKFRDRFIVLRENHLFCYEDHKKTKTTEIIELSLYDNVQLSQNKLNQYVLIPKNEEGKIRVFATESLEKATHWINAINSSINQHDKTKVQSATNESKTEENGAFISYTNLMFSALLKRVSCLCR